MDMKLGDRVLALDLGRRRTGIALSDPSGTLATPLETVALTSRRLLEHIRHLIATRRVATVVIGRPVLASGELGEIGRWAEQIGERLRNETGVNVVLWDEGLTSWEAEGLLARRAGVRKAGRSQRARASRRAAVDRVAAALILQDYLDARTRCEES